MRHVGRKRGGGVIECVARKARVGPADHAEILIFFNHDGQRRQNGVQGIVSTVIRSPKALKFTSGSSLFEL